jgi:hypothetical protein
VGFRIPRCCPEGVVEAFGPAGHLWFLLWNPSDLYEHSSNMNMGFTKMDVLMPKEALE